MTFSINPAKSWKQIKTHYLVATAGALVVCAIAAGGGVLLETTSEPAPQASSADPTVSRAVGPDLLVYIVGSQAEKEAVERAASFLDWFRDPEAGRVQIGLRAVVIEPGQEESLGLLAQLVPDASITTGTGARLTLVDVR